MRRLATLGLLGAVGLGGGCAEFDDWMEPEQHTAEYRRGGYQRDEPRPAADKPAADQGPGVYADK